MRMSRISAKMRSKELGWLWGFWLGRRKIIISARVILRWLVGNTLYRRWYLVSSRCLRLIYRYTSCHFCCSSLKRLRLCKLLLKLSSIYSGAKVLVKLGVNLLRSVMFMTSFVVMCLICYETIQRTPLQHRWTASQRNFLCSSIVPITIAFEQPHKRVDINYFVLPKTIEIFWNMLKNRRLVRDFRGMNVSVSLYYKLVVLVICAYVVDYRI